MINPDLHATILLLCSYSLVMTLPRSLHIILLVAVSLRFVGVVANLLVIVRWTMIDPGYWDKSYLCSCSLVLTLPRSLTHHSSLSSDSFSLLIFSLPSVSRFVGVRSPSLSTCRWASILCLHSMRHRSSQVLARMHTDRLYLLQHGTSPWTYIGISTWRWMDRDGRWHGRYLRVHATRRRIWPVARGQPPFFR